MPAQTTRKKKLAFVDELRAFGTQDLHMRFDGSFQKYAPRHRTANWLYAVHADKLATALKGNETFRFSWDLKRIRTWERYHRRRGRHTYLFSAEAHGGRACPITPSLLAAARARQAYVVLHEAWHSTLRLEKIRLPYALEQATGRVVGVVGAVLLAEKRNDQLLLAETREQARAWGAFARFINRTHTQLTRFYRAPGSRRERDHLWRHIQSDCDALRNRTRSRWENEELARPLNNAFFFRYHDYTRLYPLALQVYRATDSLRQTIRRYKTAGRTGAISQLRAELRRQT